MREDSRPREEAGTSVVLEGRSLDGLTPEAALSLARQGVATYSVIVPQMSGARGPRGELRVQARLRTHLRSAKVIDAANAYICDARVHDRSPGGMRLVLARNVGLPLRFGVHDDESGEIVTVSAVWRRGHVLGVKVGQRGPPTTMKRSDRLALSGRYYGVRG